MYSYRTICFILGVLSTGTLYWGKGIKKTFEHCKKNPLKKCRIFLYSVPLSIVVIVYLSALGPYILNTAFNTSFMCTHTYTVYCIVYMDE